MTNCTASPNITLPLLTAYVELLLPSIIHTKIAIDSHNAVDLLWVVQDKADLSTLRPCLNHNNGDKNSRETSNSQLSTLSALSQQPILERYELACFWLPTLPEELLQQYIPLLMRYRDLYATHLLVTLDSAINLRAYGFTPFDIVSAQTASLDTNQSISALKSLPSLTLWQFNLYDYKALPDWLNADYWANPENWNKSRW